MVLDRFVISTEFEMKADIDSGVTDPTIATIASLFRVMQIALSVKQKIIIGAIGLSLFLLAFLISIINQEEQLKVVFFDIGQSSSIFIQTLDRKQILIDGGPDSLLILEKLAQEMPFWDRSIDIVISTHSDSSHITGLIEVLRRHQIGKIIWTGMETDSLTHRQFKQELKRAEERGTKTTIAYFGQKVQLEEEIYFEILNPLTKVEGETGDLNNNSIVTRLNFNEISFLLTSDIEKERERLLVQKNKPLEQDFLSADILKIPHHGSRTSSSEEFLKAVNPTTAIIQVGDNRFGHPHQEVIDRLKERDLNIFRTDLDGTIKIISDGKRYEVTRIK